MLYPPAIMPVTSIVAALSRARARKRETDPGYVTTRKFCRGPSVETIYRTPPAPCRSASHSPVPMADYSIPLGTLVLGGLLFG